MPYLPMTDEERKEMLAEIGISSVEELFAQIPKGARYDKLLKLPEPLSEVGVLKHLRGLASKNADLIEYACFLGAGAYNHIIPTAVISLANRNEFVTAYTPYQAEISQGVLQCIYEYQSFVCALTGLDVSNASLYDGASSVAEACIMAVAASNRSKVLISETVNPEYIKVAQTYLKHQNITVELVPAKNGQTDEEILMESLDDQTAAVCIQHPNAFGCLEEVDTIGQKLKSEKALFISVVDPISLALLKPPADYDADIAVGEGQALGNFISFGGPFLGFIAARKQFLRRLPGRIVGKTTDEDSNTGYVLTLQTREQHIRRERASSNICTNQALNALTTAVYLSLLGKKGLKQVASHCLQKSHYLCNQLLNIPGWKQIWTAPFFKEFAIKIPGDVDRLNEQLLYHKIIGGFNLRKWDEGLKNVALFCVTEACTKEQIDHLIAVCKNYNQNNGG